MVDPAESSDDQDEDGNIFAATAAVAVPGGGSAMGAAAGAIAGATFYPWLRGNDFGAE